MKENTKGTIPEVKNLKFETVSIFIVLAKENFPKIFGYPLGGESSL